MLALSQGYWVHLRFGNRFLWQFEQYFTHKWILLQIFVRFNLMPLPLLFLVYLKFLVYLILLCLNWNLWRCHVCEWASNLIAPWRWWLFTSTDGHMVFGTLIHKVNFFLSYNWRVSNQIFINLPLLQWIQGDSWILLVFGSLEQRWLLLLLLFVMLPHFH